RAYLGYVPHSMTFRRFTLGPATLLPSMGTAVIEFRGRTRDAKPLILLRESIGDDAMSEPAAPARDCFMLVLILTILALAPIRATAAVDSFETLAAEFERDAQPLMERFCLDCHSTDEEQGDLDLERFAKFDDVRRNE